MGIFFRFRVRGTKKKKKKKSFENDHLTGHFRSFFFQSFFFYYVYNISRKNSKTSKVNQQSVLNIKIFYHFPKNLDRTITFNSVT